MERITKTELTHWTSQHCINRTVNRFTELNAKWNASKNGVFLRMLTLLNDRSTKRKRKVLIDRYCTIILQLSACQKNFVILSKQASQYLMWYLFKVWQILNKFNTQDLTKCLRNIPECTFPHAAHCSSFIPFPWFQLEL